MKQEKTPPTLIMIFGATGDLAKRKLFPSLYQLYLKGSLTNHFALLGVGRREWSHDRFKDHVRDSLQASSHSKDQIESFIEHCAYQSHDVSDSNSYKQLKDLANVLDQKFSLDGNRIFYLAMAPEFFGTITDHLKQDGLTDTNGFCRLVIEKPFGHDLPSASALNKQIRQSFSEEQIYRIDHYLGKEMVQNIEVIRFANAIFEPLWNSRFISNIQITSSETLGVEERGRYYETSGALRDMVQNHMLQMVALLAMEPPISLNTDEIRSEKVRALRSMRPVEGKEVDDYFVRGQYDAGIVNDAHLKGYRDGENVDPDSNTETFVAGKVMIDNFRWAGVPFFIRTGKRMAVKSTKIVVQFKDIPMNLYYNKDRSLDPNLLVIHIQPDEGVTLHLNAKKTSEGVDTQPVKLSYSASSIDGINTPEAYEKLLLDCIMGDATNFTHWDEVRHSWSFVDKISDHWESTKEESFPNYESGTMGPHKSDQLLAEEGFEWWPIGELDVNKG